MKAHDVDRSAVVTGAASGIGRALCLELGRRGWKVGALDVNVDAAGETVEMVRLAGGSGEALFCDVRDLGSVQAAADHFFDRWGSVGVLVNNAGVGTGGKVGEVLMEEWRRVVDTDLWGVIYGCHCFIPRMKDRGAGWIMNIASTGAFLVVPETAPYAVAKAGVLALTETMAPELAPFNIGVTVVCPSFVRTNIEDTMGCTEEWHRDILRAALECSGDSPDAVAARAVEGMLRGRLYVLPQATGRASWLFKRLAPGTYVRMLSWLNRRGWLRPAMMRVVRMGV
jgi:NAD(P)-dependent dehydrogenase (short-subunit alcohol dehydrogenase family)